MRPRSPRRPHRQRAIGRALALGAVALVWPLAGCPGDARDATPEATDLALPEQTEEQLAALGYGAWSEPGDAGDLARRGVTVLDRERAAPGLNLFKQRGKREAVLMDLAGHVVHVWRGPEPAERAARRAGERREGSDAALADPFEMGETRDRRSWHWVRAFEVTREGQIVSEYWHTEIDSRTEQRGTFYRFARLAPGYFEPGLLAGRSPDGAERD